MVQEEEKVKYYKGRYIIAFYDYKTDTQLYLFNNINEIIKFLHLQLTRKNNQYIKLLLYRALKRENHFTKMLGSKMTVYIIDMKEEEE